MHFLCLVIFCDTREANEANYSSVLAFTEHKSHKFVVCKQRQVTGTCDVRSIIQRSEVCKEKQVIQLAAQCASGAVYCMDFLSKSKKLWLDLGQRRRQSNWLQPYIAMSHKKHRIHTDIVYRTESMVSQCKLITNLCNHCHCLHSSITGGYGALQQMCSNSSVFAQGTNPQIRLDPLDE